MNSKQLNIRIDADLKDKVDDILEQLGLTQSQAIRLFFKKIVLTNGIPFSINIPNKDTIEAIEETKNKNKTKKYKSKKDLFDDLGI